MNATNQNQKISLPHPNRNDVLGNFSRQAAIQLERGNYDAVRQIVDGAESEVEGYAIQLEDHVAVLDFETRLTRWLEFRGILTVRQVLNLTIAAVVDSPRFERHWWDAIADIQRRVNRQID